MMKKGKAVLAQPAAPLALRMRPMSSAPGPLRGGGDDAAYWASLRYRGLLQDYQELLKVGSCRLISIVSVDLIRNSGWFAVSDRVGRGAL
jgi:hypothetical protein